MNNDQRVADCRRLFDKYNGRQHEQIEREMRALGHTRFRRRILYTRRERGRRAAGWIERYKWRSGGVEEKRSRGARRRLHARGQEGAWPARPSGKFNHSKWRRQNKRGRPQRLAALPPDERKGSARPAASIMPYRGWASARGVAPDPFVDRDGRAEPFRSSGGGAAKANPAPDENSTNSMNSPNPMNSMNFPDWLKYVSPYMSWDAAHHRHIIETLERVTSGECKRLMIFMPPRHGKSELVTVRYAAWRMRQKPETNIIIGSYNQRLANRFSRKIKTVTCDDMAKANEGVEEVRSEGDASAAATNRPVMATPGGRSSSPPRLLTSSTSPFPFARPRLKNSESEWETRVGGGLRAAGVGSGVTGFGANLLIVDDPVKSRAEAESIKYRERVWDWFNDDLYTRLEPDGQIILIQTRWHEDDLAGRLLAEENGGEWTVIDLPALAEGIKQDGQDEKDGKNAAVNEDANIYPVHPLHPVKVSDVLGRQTGDALWPERFNTEHLENTKEKIGAYSFASLYQQHPVPAEGGLFKKEWFNQISDKAPNGLIWKRGYDLGITANATSDYTASYRVAYDKEGNLYIDGGFRARIDYPEQRRYILGRIREELDTEHGIEETANGSAVVQELRKDVRLQGRAFRGVRPKGDKVNRCLAWMNLAEAGKVRLVRGRWNKEFIDECCSFPLGTHDDQIDAVSIAVAMHTRRRYGFYRF